MTTSPTIPKMNEEMVLSPSPSGRNLVELQEWMGSDRSVALAAWTSTYDKRRTGEFSDVNPGQRSTKHSDYLRQSAR